MIRHDDDIKTIGIILEELNTDFCLGLIHTVLSGVPENKKLRIVVLAGKQEHMGDSVIKTYRKTYNSVYHIEEQCKFDGLIVALTDLFGKLDGTKGAGIYYNYESIPKVYVATEKEGEVTVNYDNEKGIREAIECLVNVHGINKICMLGGRKENIDSVKRKQIFIDCLKENNLQYNEDMFEGTDMSMNTFAEAERLLDRNPDTQAIFCVNDQAAVGLYKALEKRSLVPGKDLYVFGFDNTFLAGRLIPPLASIGPDNVTLGQKAIELLTDMMDGKEASSVEIPTRLHGRDSFEYETNPYSPMELLSADREFIDRMYDDIFYRYKDEIIDNTNIDLKRLFYEFMSRMLFSMKNRFLSDEDYEEIGTLIDAFFDNGAMEFTDAPKFVREMDKIQDSVNSLQRSASANVKNNRLFVKIRDKAIIAQADKIIRSSTKFDNERRKMSEFLMKSMNFQSIDRGFADSVINNFDLLGFQNAALYLYKAPKHYEADRKPDFPDTIYLKAVMREGELFIVPRERQAGPVADIFKREELSSRVTGFVAFPVLYNYVIFGMLVCELNLDVAESGEYVADQLGRAIYTNYINKFTKPM